MFVDLPILDFIAPESGATAVLVLGVRGADIQYKKMAMCCILSSYSYTTAEYCSCIYSSKRKLMALQALPFQQSNGVSVSGKIVATSVPLQCLYSRTREDVAVTNLSIRVIKPCVIQVDVLLQTQNRLASKLSWHVIKPCVLQGDLGSRLQSPASSKRVSHSSSRQSLPSRKNSLRRGDSRIDHPAGYSMDDKDQDKDQPKLSGWAKLRMARRLQNNVKEVLV